MTLGWLKRKTHEPICIHFEISVTLASHKRSKWAMNILKLSIWSQKRMRNFFLKFLLRIARHMTSMSYPHTLPHWSNRIGQTLRPQPTELNPLVWLCTSKCICGNPIDLNSRSTKRRGLWVICGEVLFEHEFVWAKKLEFSFCKLNMALKKMTVKVVVFSWTSTLSLKDKGKKLTMLISYIITRSSNPYLDVA